MVEAMMTFACLVLLPDFLRKTVVQGMTSSRRSGCIHIVPPLGKVVRTSPFSCWRWGSELMTLISTAGMGYTAVGLEVTGQTGCKMSCWLWQSSAPFSALERLRRQALAVCLSKTSSSWSGGPTFGGISSREDHWSCRHPRDSSAQTVSIDHLYRAS